jgi:hypothetical protein
MIKNTASGHEVLMEVDDNILQIVGDPQGISDHQLWPHPIYSLNLSQWNSVLRKCKHVFEY